MHAWILKSSLVLCSLCGSYYILCHVSCRVVSTPHKVHWIGLLNITGTIPRPELFCVISRITDLPSLLTSSSHSQHADATAMDVLEAREAALRRQLFGAQSNSDSNSSFGSRTADLNARLEQLYGAVTGFSRLHELCTSMAVIRTISKLLL